MIFPVGIDTVRTKGVGTRHRRDGLDKDATAQRTRQTLLLEFYQGLSHSGSQFREGNLFGYYILMVVGVVVVVVRHRRR